MAISSSSGSNFIDYPSSPSSSSSSASSLDSIPESREPTPEYDPTAAYEALTPLHWDAEEFDFEIVSEDYEHQTEGEDLRLLFQEEPESSSEEGFSWDGADSSSEEEKIAMAAGGWGFFCATWLWEEDEFAEKRADLG